MKRRINTATHYAVCLNNEGNEASLEPGKLYKIVDDEHAAGHGLIGIIDESGESYLFPSEWFYVLDVPPTLARALKEIAA